jgi:hypothetical protein
MSSNRKRIIEDEYTVQMITDSNYDAHISEDEIFPHGSDSKKEETEYMQWTNSTQA